jgi:hypothetical protein
MFSDDCTALEHMMATVQNLHRAFVHLTTFFQLLKLASNDVERRLRMARSSDETAVANLKILYRHSPDGLSRGFSTGVPREIVIEKKINIVF